MNEPQRWYRPEDHEPPHDTVVNVLMSSGIVTRLRKRGRLWFVPSGDVYVYYEPTFWQPIERN